MKIAELNRLDKDEFSEVLGGIYESSPWVPMTAFDQLPFRDFPHLQAALRQAVDTSDRQVQLDLIRAHPDLGGKLGRKADLTEESAREQSSLGLDALEDAEFEAFCQLNQTYREKFGFPFVLCVGHVKHREEILSAFRRRIELDRDEEFAEALEQIHQIARLRLEALDVA